MLPITRAKPENCRARATILQSEVLRDCSNWWRSQPWRYACPFNSTDVAALSGIKMDVSSEDLRTKVSIDSVS